MDKLTIFLFAFTVTKQAFGQSLFTTKPNDTVLGARGEPILLPWVYSSAQQMAFIKWFRTNFENKQVQTIMMLVAGTSETILDDYKGRVTYNGSARMILHNLQLSDEGWIACSVDFANGQTEYAKTFLEIGTKPHLTNIPAQSFVVENENITIECTTMAKPKPVITWFDKDNKKLSNDTHYYVFSMVAGTINQETQIKSILTIRDAKIKDAGKYRCKSVNDISSDEAETVLTVYYKPINTKILLQYTTRLEKDSNVITCSADAVPQPINYEIYHKDRLLSNTTSGIYSISSVKNYDEGTYKCLPRNWVGVGAEARQDLVVNVAPAIYDSSPSTVIITEDNLLIIVCKFNADPNPVVTWKKYKSGNENNLNINTTKLYENSTLFQIGSTVTISRVERSDYGIYSCRAGNTFGEIVKNISLVVHYPPSITFHTIKQPAFYINESGSDTVTCVARGYPRPIMNWYRDAVAIQNGKHKIIESFVEGDNYVEVKTIIILNSVTKHDSGSFRCEASNVAGTVSQNTTLNVYYKPEITAQMNEKSYVNLADGLSLSCVARSIEQSTFIWYKNNIKVVSGNGNILIKVLRSLPPHVSSFLTINPIKSSDSDSVYKCVARNSQGEDSRSTVVSVYFGPSINKFPGNSIITSEYKSNYEILCEIQANPKPLIRWLKYGQPISVNTINSNYLVDEKVITESTNITILQSTLIIKQVQREDFGNWTCHGSNTIVGDVYSEIDKRTQLTVTYDPRFEFISPGNFHVNITDTVIFICRVKASPKPFVWWLLPTTITQDSRFSFATTTIADITQFGSLEAKLTITNVGKRDHGDYICLTNNTITADRRVSKLIVQYKPTVSSDFTENIHIVSENSITHIEVIVDANPASVIQWFGTHQNGSVYKEITTNIEIVQIAVIRDFENKYKSRLMFPGGVKRINQMWYMVKVKNPLGQVEKRTYLVVQWKPQPETLLSGTQNVIKGQSPSLICRFLSNPKNDINWYKNGNLVTNIQYTTIVLTTNASITLTQSTLTFINAGPTDRANYTCRSTNVIGHSEQWKFLNVQYPPILQVSSTARMVDIQQSMTLSCRSDANPAVTKYTWKKENKTLDLNLENYAILQVTANTRGNYTCTPSNSLGNGSTVKYSITIRIPPTFTKQATCQKFADLADPNQSYFVCTCEGNGSPTPQAYWTKYPSSTVVSNGTMINMTVSASNDGTYYCHLKNSNSDIQSPVQVAYFVPPFGVWSLWDDCNATCGDGHQSRTRVCNVKPCTIEDLTEATKCVGGCTGQQDSEDENSWMYALYAIVPCVILLLVLAVIWIGRLNRNVKSGLSVFVPVNRDLYLPSSISNICANNTQIDNIDTDTIEDSSQIAENLHEHLKISNSIDLKHTINNSSILQLSRLMESSLSSKCNRVQMDTETS